VNYIGNKMAKCNNPNCEKEIEPGEEITINGYTSCSDCKILYDNLTQEI
jgi:hypothetical protein